MNDYKHHSVAEAVSIEISKQFIEALKKMDSDVGVRRLTAIIQQFGYDDGFLNTAARFIAVKNASMSVD